MLPPDSRCSERRALIYWWVSKDPSESDLDAAVNELMACLEKPGRLWNMYNRGVAKAEFRARLEAAQRGDLIPVEHVKYLDRGSAAWIYEIRWQNITVQVLEPGGKRRFVKLKVRALHAETPRLPNHLLGLHAHEKIVIVVDGDKEASKRATNDAQNAEIDVAVRAYWDGDGSNWGLV